MWFNLPEWDSIVLYCIVLYCVVLCCIVLHCIVYEGIRENK